MIEEHNYSERSRCCGGITEIPTYHLPNIFFPCRFIKIIGIITNLPISIWGFFNRLLSVPITTTDSDEKQE